MDTPILPTLPTPPPTDDLPLPIDTPLQSTVPTRKASPWSVYLESIATGHEIRTAISLSGISYGQLATIREDPEQLAIERLAIAAGAIGDGANLGELLAKGRMPRLVAKLDALLDSANPEVVIKSAARMQSVSYGKPQSAVTLDQSRHVHLGSSAAAAYARLLAERNGTSSPPSAPA